MKIAPLWLTLQKNLKKKKLLYYKCIICNFTLNILLQTFEWIYFWKTFCLLSVVITPKPHTHTNTINKILIHSKKRNWQTLEKNMWKKTGSLWDRQATFSALLSQNFARIIYIWYVYVLWILYFFIYLKCSNKNRQNNCWKPYQQLQIIAERVGFIAIFYSMLKYENKYTTNEYLYM